MLRILRLAFWLILLFPAVPVRAQSTLIPLTTRRDMVFDHAGKYLYISTSDGLVRRYNLATQQLDQSYNLGGSLNGIDISPDDSFLLAAQNNNLGSGYVVQRLNLVTGAVTNVPYANVGHETGAWDVAIGSNGLALFTTSTTEKAGCLCVRSTLRPILFRRAQMIPVPEAEAKAP